MKCYHYELHWGNSRKVESNLILYLVKKGCEQRCWSEGIHGSSHKCRLPVKETLNCCSPSEEKDIWTAKDALNFQQRGTRHLLMVWTKLKHINLTETSIPWPLCGHSVRDGELKELHRESETTKLNLKQPAGVSKPLWKWHRDLRRGAWLRKLSLPGII